MSSLYNYQEVKVTTNIDYYLKSTFVSVMMI